MTPDSDRDLAFQWGAAVTLKLGSSTHPSECCTALTQFDRWDSAREAELVGNLRKVTEVYYEKGGKSEPEHYPLPKLHPANNRRTESACTLTLFNVVHELDWYPENLVWRKVPSLPAGP